MTSATERNKKNKSFLLKELRNKYVNTSTLVFLDRDTQFF